MKANKYILSLLTAGMLLTGCDDQIMEWGRPAGENAVTKSDIPLAVKEVLANYEAVKTYAAQYSSNFIVGLGLGATLYNENYEGVYRTLSDENYQMYTFGNAMKMDAMLSSSGTFNFTTIDAFFDNMPADMKIYGHNFIWYQQQKQDYLKSLIAPTMVVTTDGDIASVLKNGAFDSDLSYWSGWGNSSTREWSSNGGEDGSGCALLTNPTDASTYSAQFVQSLDPALTVGTTYTFRFKAKSSVGAGIIQFAVQNSTTYAGEGYHSFSVGTDWQTYELEFTPTLENMNRLCINFGQVAAQYWIDDVEFGIKQDNAKENVLAGDSPTDGMETDMAKGMSLAPARRKATTITYTLKTADEKRQALLTAMEAWIKGMAEHLQEKNVTPYGYDVINEPITDGTNLVRGVDAGAFGGSTTDDNGNVTYDSAPTETTTDGLNLNWGANRFYWGYYVPDYAVKAFQYSRQYLPADTKLFVNDYNLETSPRKLAALISFVNAIDAANGSAIVDGIGTQCHYSLSGATDDEEANAKLIATAKELFDAMFKTMAATGKLVRVTELDIALGTGNPSSAQYKAQSDCYRMIFESYKENVSAAQQSGITIWTLSDNEQEHLYWLKGDVPNLYDAGFLRKWAYKGVCDGIAGKDIGLQFGGDDYKAYYEKSNVSSTVTE